MNYHLYYSEKQADIGGTSIYKTEEGKEIEVSEVCLNKLDDEYFKRFKDRVYLGVGVYFKQGRPGGSTYQYGRWRI